jgi:tRNA threonylcarbamoyladenosine modification (KEOPS) complex  Pcc1 subunit
MSLKCHLKIALNDISQKKAKAVKDALEPDNVKFPENLTLQVENIDNKLVFNFQSQGDMKKLVSTVDEVMEHIQVALKVIE